MVSTTNIIRDSIFYIKNYLTAQITDPISATRGGEQFIMTSYPQRPTRFPIITIKDTNSFDKKILGFQSQAMEHYIEIEVRAWGRTTKERDDLADQIYDKLRGNQIGASGTSQATNLHDFQLTSRVNVEGDGPNADKSKVMTFKFLYISGET